MAPRVDQELVSSPDDLAQRCGDVGWPVEEAGAAFVVQVPELGQVRIPKRGAKALALVEENLRGPLEAMEQQLHDQLLEMRATAAQEQLVFPAGEPAAQAGEPESVVSLALHTQTMDVTPEMAQRWLERPLPMLSNGAQLQQRRLDLAWVLEIKSWIELGEWRTTHEGVALAPVKAGGGVLDGQHRLHAVVHSGKTVRMLVAYEVDPDAFDCMNRGKKRTVVDGLTIESMTDPFLKASVAKALFCYEEWQKDPEGPMRAWTLWNRQKMTTSATRRVLAAYPELERSLTAGASMVRAQGFKATPAGGVLFHFLVSQVCKTPEQQQILADFIDGFKEGRRLDRGHPAHTARTWAPSMMVNTHRALRRETLLLGLLLAWNKYAVGEEYPRMGNTVWPIPMQVPVAPRVPVKHWSQWFDNKA